MDAFEDTAFESGAFEMFPDETDEIPVELGLTRVLAFDLHLVRTVEMTQER